jgi:hypothetical protein
MSRLDSRNFDPLKIEKVRNLSLATYLSIILIDEMFHAYILLHEYFTRTYLLSSHVTYIDPLTYPHRMGKTSSPAPRQGCWIIGHLYCKKIIHVISSSQWEYLGTTRWAKRVGLI